MSGTETRLGVVILCHHELDRAALSARYWAEGGASVVIHVDSAVSRKAFGRLQARLSDLPQVFFCKRRHVEWGMFSLVAATQDAATMLLERFPELTHVYLASGSCLPLRAIDDLRIYLMDHPQTDFIESVSSREVGWTVNGLNDERFTLYFPVSWRRRRKLFDRLVALQRRLRLRRAIPQGIMPHLGSQWWCLTRETLTAILDDPRREEFERYFRQVWIPDESYFQTLVRRHTRGIESRSLTLSNFDSQGKPYTFYDDHQQMLEDSGCFAARKIWPHASGLYAHFPRPPQKEKPARLPQPGQIDHLISRAVVRRDLGRPGLYMQSRFPLRDRENGKTARQYAIFQGFSDVFPDFETWLSKLVDADVHGHLFAPECVEFGDRGRIGPGCLSDSALMRDYDPQAFLTNLIRATPRFQVFQHSARDSQALNWFMTTDSNAHIAVISGAWLLPLYHSGMPFDDIRRMAARFQRSELEQLKILNSVWRKARMRIWELSDFLTRPEPLLRGLLYDLGYASEAGALDLPPMREAEGLGSFLQDLRNAGLQPRLMGEFPSEGVDHG